MALVVMLLGVLLWILHRNETEEERHALIKDILWVEQNLNFTLVSAEEKLVHVAVALAQGAPMRQIQTETQALLANNPSLERIVVRGADGRLIRAMPPLESPGAMDGPADGSPWAEAFTLAKSIGRVAWTSALSTMGRGNTIEAHVPFYADGQFAGMVVGVFSLDGLLVHNVPWWVVEKYKVEVVDGGGAVVASRTSVEPSHPGLSHQVRFEPPGHGMGIVATVYRSGTNLARNVLAASIFGLTLLALSSLWAVRRHVGHRLDAEHALREEHAFRKAMEDSLTVGMRARDLDGRIIYVNPAFCRMVGYPAEEIVGRLPPMPYWLPDEIENTMEAQKRVLAGQAPADGYELRFRRGNGEVFDVLTYEAPLIDASGRQTGWMGTVVDITERKRAAELARQEQENLQRTSRLITMGEMASTLAHELNQPLSAIASYNTGCLNKLASGQFSPAEFEQALTKLGVQAQRAGQIIRRVHDFVRKAEPNLQPCSVNEVIEDTVGFIEFDAKNRGVKLDVDLAPADPMVEADKILLEQVLLNLARNGIEAMAGTPAYNRRLGVAVSCCAEQVVVQVSDNGTGIAPETASNLFQPFFTTKEEGMGMGLNICRSIIEFHRGRLWFEPKPGGGSVFQFSLPLRDAA